MKRYTFKIPATVYIEVVAEHEEDARDTAASWQRHAHRWEHLAIVEDIADCYEPFADLKGPCDIDSTAMVYVDDTSEPVVGNVEDEPAEPEAAPRAETVAP